MSGIKQEFIGEVVSVKMSKTVVVSVKSTKIHPKYHKRYTTVKKYMAHYEDEAVLETGQSVKIQGCRPISKNKKWVVTEVLQS